MTHGTAVTWLLTGVLAGFLYGNIGLAIASIGILAIELANKGEW